MFLHLYYKGTTIQINNLYIETWDYPELGAEINFTERAEIYNLISKCFDLLKIDQEE